MFFDERFERDPSKEKDEKAMETIEPMHIDIIPFGEQSVVDTRSIAASHSQGHGVANHPHINEVLKTSDDLELVPLHDETPHEAQEHLSKSERATTNPSRTLGDRIDRIRRKHESEIIMKHNYVPFRGRKN